MALIKTIDELRKHTKINKNMNFEVLQPYVQDAHDKYLVPAFGEDLLEEIEGNETDPLHSLLCRSLAPFSLALASDEMSINFGEAGHTITKTEHATPASDAKIAKASGSLYERGWANLERALKYVVKHVSEYPSWNESDYAKKRTSVLFDGSESFQDNGLVEIDYSFLTFIQLRTLILRVEKSEALVMLPADLEYKTLLDSDSPADRKLIAALQAFTGSRVAAIHTAQTTRRQRAQPGINTEYKALIRPLYEDIDETGNYFETQATFWASQVNEFLIAAGYMTDDRSLEWNSEEKRIFIASARQEKSTD